MDYKHLVRKMIEDHLKARGIRDKRVLDVMNRIPRHLFVGEEIRDQAYSDQPLPIGEEQTISQPYIVALMTEALFLKGYEKVLEIGTGSGYQTAILSCLADKVFSIERIQNLATKARKTLDELHCSNVIIQVRDGTYGWKEEAPFDAIIVTAAAPKIPGVYIDQLMVGGRLVIPIGDKFSQTLMKFTKKESGVKEEDLGGCRFVPLIGDKGWKQ